MIWQDILIERPVTDDEIAVALATAFEGAVASVAVVDESGTIDTESTAILCERWHVEGDFAVHMHVFLRTDDTVAMTERLGDTKIVGKFARALRTACFIGDDDINPFTGLLIRAPHDVQPASLDPEAEDEGIFRLASVATHVG